MARDTIVQRRIAKLILQPHHCALIDESLKMCQILKLNRQVQRRLALVISRVQIASFDQNRHHIFRLGRNGTKVKWRESARIDKLGQGRIDAEHKGVFVVEVNKSLISLSRFCSIKNVSNSCFIFLTE